MTYGQWEEEISGYNMREIANAITVESQYENQIQSSNLNGTIVFNTRMPFQLYVDFYTIKTKSGESFVDLKNRILGENKAQSLKLEYLRNCEGVK